MKAVKATGKEQLIIAGIVTEVCVALPALSALEEGYEVLEHAAPYLTADEELGIQTGLEYWLTPPPHKPLRARPYKQFLVTLSAIYPLTQLIPWLLNPLLQSDPLGHWPAAGDLVGWW